MEATWLTNKEMIAALKVSIRLRSLNVKALVVAIQKMTHRQRTTLCAADQFFASYVATLKRYKPLYLAYLKRKEAHINKRR